MTTINRRAIIKSGLGSALALALPGGGFAAEGAESPVVATTAGSVRGYSDDGISAFKGVRYGADTGPRRFMPPMPPQPWERIADTFEYGATAPQDRAQAAISEDCLFLNIWTPGANDGRKRPVMFYIHGGAYSHGSGSSPLYDGSALARRGDVVVVTVNHRLNAFGYLYLQRFANGAFPDAGNCGQLDLVLALQWVRDNIEAFGGDPNCVLAFGQSGGGAKIATMMAMPAAAGLFHRAASMSGQQVTASGPANATLRTQAFLDAAGIGDDDIEKLQTLPLEQLLRGLEAADPVLDGKPVYFGPVLDMRSLTRHPFYPDAAPQSAHIPMIIGNTHDETRAFLRDPSYDNLDWQDLPELLIPNTVVDIQPEFVISEYRRIYPHYSATQVFFAATTAGRSWRGAIEELEARAKQSGANTYAYHLDWQSPVEPKLGAPHAFDIPLIFGNLDAPGSLTGTDADAREVSAMMSDAFISFARSGKPGSKQLPEWKPFTLPNRETMLFDRPARLANDPRGEERRIFARVPYVQPGT
ncbi:MAG: carboxylesterase/lipase family protein [Gammaproteobacteria bacterium]|nr:carboxylesterase/lipase family protein [Gammaproteobacteria bacterium]MDH5239256.1 carboxylesterase/lipase family protein [Gammaproteobacteria bacterium]MDH5259992.1 carboxylesterase/lipase family protein [Gammaproteobacteria bacterium]MDH5620481.1 carboxylesterase/lipase family protein [Gammaproteobacteria bacterium]